MPVIIPIKEQAGKYERRGLREGWREEMQMPPQVLEGERLILDIK